MGTLAPEPLDEAGFWDVYEQALPLVYGYLVRRSDASVAEDLTQEVMVTAARTARDGHGRKVTVAWLLAVAKSRLIDHYRSQARHDRNLSLAWSQRGDDSARSAEAVFEDARLAPEVEVALGQLPGMQRAALVMHHLDDLSVAEVASALGKTVRATESLLARARASFREALEDHR